METKNTLGLALTVIGISSKFINIPAPMGWSGFSIGVALLLSNLLPEEYQPSVPQGILYLVGIGCLAGALSWQILSMGGRQQGLQTTPMSTPEQVSSPPQPRRRPDEALWSGGGSMYPPGVPTTTTAYNDSSTKDLKDAVDDVSARLLTADVDRWKRLNAASSKTGVTAVQRQADIEKADVQTTKEFQGGLLMESRPLFDELLKRLNRPYPQTTADGMTVNSYTAISSGILRGPHPLADLAAYLRALAGDLRP